MPKSLRQINDFSGGLVNAYNSKDLPEGSVYEAREVQFSTKGQIKLLNPFQKGQSLSQIQFGELGLSFANVSGLFRFGSDYNLGRRVMIVGHKDDTPASGYVTFYTNKPHGLHVGMIVPIVLNSDGIGDYGYATIYTIEGPFSFSIANADITSDTTVIGDITADTGLTATITAQVQDQRLILNAATDDDTNSANALGRGSLLVEHSGGENEIMLVADIESDTTLLVWRDLTDVSAVNAISAARVNSIAYAVTSIPEESNVHSGWVYVQQEQYTDPRQYSNLNYYLIMNGPHIGLFDGTSFMSNIGRLSSTQYTKPSTTSTGPFSNGHIAYNDFKTNCNTDNIVPGIYYAKGGLRISDGNYNNTLNTTNRLVKYFKPRKFGIFTSTVLEMANSGYSTFASGANTYIHVHDDAVDGKVLINSNGVSGITLGDNEIITVRFEIEAKQVMGTNSSNTVVESNMLNMPYLYWGNDVSTTLFACESSVKKAQLGYNVMIWRATDNAADNSLHEDNLIFLAGATDNMYLYFTNETKNVSWKVTNLEIFRTYAGVESGWRTVDQQIYAPNDNMLVEGGATFTESNAVDSSKLYMAIAEDTTVDGDWQLNSGHRYVNFGYSFLYDDDRQESKITGMVMADTSIYVDLNGSDGDGLKGEFMINATGNNTDKFGWESRIVGCQVYLTGVDSVAITNSIDLEDPLWFATLMFDPDEESVLFDGTQLSWAVTGQADTMKCTFTGVLEFPGLTYLLNTGYSHNEESLYARYATGCIANNKAYIGNITYKRDDGEGRWNIHADRMLQSPVGQYDVFPSSRKIDASVSDGDAIVKLMSHDNRIFQFKKHNVYVINVSEPREVLEKTLNGLGIISPTAATETINGIAWVNKSGCFIYDGEKIDNLMRGQIDFNAWGNNFSSEAVIGYSEKDQAMICAGSSLTYIYSFKDQHWISSSSLPTSDMSNMVPTKAGGVTWIQTSETNFGNSEYADTENVSISNLTHGVLAKKAEGYIKFTAFIDVDGDGEIADETSSYQSFLTDASLYIRQGSTNILIATGLTTTSTNNATKGWETAMRIRNAINDYRDSNGYQIYEATFIGEGEQWDQSVGHEGGNNLNNINNYASYEVCTVHIKTLFGGASFNSDASGTAGIFFNSSTGTDSLLASGLDIKAVGEYVAGVNGTASSLRINFDRGGVTVAYVSYIINMIKIGSSAVQMGGVNPFPEGDDWQDYEIEFGTDAWPGGSELRYSTVDGDDNNAVRDGVKTLLEEYIMPVFQLSLNTYITFSTGTSYLQLSTKAENNLFPNSEFYIFGDIYQDSDGTLTINSFEPVDMDVQYSGQINSQKPGGDVYTWKPLSPISATTVSGFSFQTADIFGESVGQRKKVYKLYINYRCSGDSNVLVNFIIDGKLNAIGNRKTFSASTSTNYTSSTLDSTSGEWALAELKPSTVSELNNIYTIRILITGVGEVPKDFSINDINIVYRVKSVK